MVLAANTPVMAHENNFYGGIALGGGILEITSTANQEYLGVTVPFITNEERYATNVDASLLLTWKQRSQNLVFGVDGDIGWGGKRKKPLAQIHCQVPTFWRVNFSADSTCRPWAFWDMLAAPGPAL